MERFSFMNKKKTCIEAWHRSFGGGDLQPHGDAAAAAAERTPTHATQPGRWGAPPARRTSSLHAWPGGVEPLRVEVCLRVFDNQIRLGGLLPAHTQAAVDEGRGREVFSLTRGAAWPRPGCAGLQGRGALAGACLAQAGSGSRQPQRRGSTDEGPPRHCFCSVQLALGSRTLAPT